MYNDYIKGTKESAAKNNLRAIALMEADYYSDNNNFYINGCSKMDLRTNQINNYLFGGKKTLDENGPYNYCVDFDSSGFEVNAWPSDTSSDLFKFCLNNNNEMKEKGQC